MDRKYGIANSQAIISRPRFMAKPEEKRSNGKRKAGERINGKPLKYHENGKARIAAATRKR